MRRRTTPAALSAGEVPAELYDYRAGAWATVEAARGWRVRHGLPAGGQHHTVRDDEHARQRRRADALAAWALASGYRSARWPVLPDWPALRALDLVAAGSPTREQVMS